MFFLNAILFIVLNILVVATCAFPSDITESDKICECVKTHLCDKAKGEIITDGFGIISFRGGATCKNKDEVCCKLPTEAEGSFEEDDNDGLAEAWYGYDDISEDVVVNTTAGAAVTERQQTSVTKTTTTTTTTQRPITTDNVTKRQGVVEEQTEGDEIMFGQCGTRYQSFTEEKVFGNNDDTWTQQGDFPWTLLVKYLIPGENGARDEQVLVSGASLIAPAIAITTAHGIEKKIAGNLIVRAGEWDLGNEDESIQPQEVRVKRVILHPKYDQRPIQYDIAILVLERPFTHNAAVNTICLPPDKRPIDWSKCYATGWGASGPADIPRDNALLRKAKLPLVSHDQCQVMLWKTELGKRYRLHPSFICAGGDGGMDTCKGDGGGPLACESPDPDNNAYYLVGVTSWGLDCGRTDVPGAYTNVLFVLPWIKSTLGQLLRDRAIDTY